MKKGRIITAAVLVATMLIGAGYAAWTSSVEIDHNVNTGNMNVEFIKPNYTAAPELNADQYVVPSVNRTNKLVTFTLNNMYPGASYTTLTEEKNTGTIPVKFDNAVITPATGFNAVLYQNTTVNFDCWIYDKDGNHIQTISPNQQNIKLADLSQVLTNTLKDTRLEPNQTLRLKGHSEDQLMTFTLSDGTAVNNDTQNKSMTFTIQLNWKQFNE